VKIRQGFVSNSSSSSFVIRLHKLTEEQILRILDPDYGSQNCGAEDGFPFIWSIAIDRDSDRIEGYTAMDNFSMYEYFEDIGVPNGIVEWGD